MHTTPPVAAPSYLAGHETLYAQDPKAAALEWFCQADFGLFLHYGLYSLLGRGEWVMLREAIPVAEYEQLKGRFTASRFDADCITDLALQAEMRYVNITTRHHDGFCLFETAQNDYHSMASPAKRDLVGELAAQCARKGPGPCGHTGQPAPRPDHVWQARPCRGSRSELSRTGRSRRGAAW